MPISFAESKQLLRAWILADATLSALVDGRVYGVHLSSADAQTVLQTKPIIVFEFLAGSGRYFREFETPIVEFYVYSKGGADEVAQVYDRLYVRLQEERIQLPGIGTSGTARETERPTDGRSEEIAAWYCRSRWALYLLAGPE
jgi:hypothetical protein